jgi:hypothetical protein
MPLSAPLEDFAMNRKGSFFGAFARENGLAAQGKEEMSTFQTSHSEVLRLLPVV